MKRLLIPIAALAILAGEPAVAAPGPVGVPRVGLGPVQALLYRIGQVLAAGPSTTPGGGLP